MKLPKRILPNRRQLTIAERRAIRIGERRTRANIYYGYSSWQEKTIVDPDTKDVVTYTIDSYGRVKRKKNHSGTNELRSSQDESK